LKIANETLSDLEENLLLFFTGYSRTASDILGDQLRRTSSGDAAMIDNLHYVKDVRLRIKDALEQGDTEKFARLMHEHWE
jgi:D-glycero-alpha-D-manno-heptose-7-phosphate kinase